MEVDTTAFKDNQAMSSEVSSTELKKMKQVRLAFAPLEDEHQKKRKISSEDKNPKPPKILCKETKKIDLAKLNKNAEILEQITGIPDSSLCTQEGKENISTIKSSECIPVDSPICKKYEADSSCSNIDSVTPIVITIHEEESNKKRSKRVPNNSPSIISLFKKITEKKHVSVIHLSDDEEPERKKLKNVANKSENTNDRKSISNVNDESDCIVKSMLNDSLSIKDSVVEKELDSLLETPNQSHVIVGRKKTSKQLEREQQRKNEQEERNKVKAKMLKDKSAQKLQKENEKQAKLEEIQKMKEERLKKKQEENEAKTKEREEKRFKKEEEKSKKEEVKLLKELEKKEEKQKKEEEKLKQEELKRLFEVEENEKKEKLKTKFAKFFVPKRADSSLRQTQTNDEDVSAGPFMMFRVKENMKLAPLVRRDFSEDMKQTFDELFRENKSDVTYLTELKEPTYVKQKNDRTLPVQEKVDECEIIDDDCIDDVNNVVTGSEGIKQTVKAKLLMFCENRRPAYYGTWTKKSTKVSGRTPFVRENDLLDYDYDSDNDWEEEESGESLSDSEGEEEEGENNYEFQEDNVFFVPHGYLSDDEGQDDETFNEGMQEIDDVRKEILKKKQEEFESEMKQKMKPLKPKVYGCVWIDDEKSHQAYCQLVKIFTNYKAMNIFGGEYPIGTTKGGDNIPYNIKDLKNNEEDDDTASGKKFSKIFPETAVPDLIRLIHGNRHRKRFLINEFAEHVKKHNNPEDGAMSPLTPSKENITKQKILQMIKSIGQYKKASEIGGNSKYKCWTVSEDIRKKYDLGELSLDNSWSYFLQPKEFPSEIKEEVEEPINLKASVSLITKFTKVLTELEKAEKMKHSSPSVDKVTDPNSTEIKVRTTVSDVKAESSKDETAQKVTQRKSSIKKFFEKIPTVKMNIDCIELD